MASFFHVFHELYMLTICHASVYPGKRIVPYLFINRLGWSYMCLDYILQI